jgi:transposase InsO family protein
LKQERDQQRLRRWCIRRLQEDWTVRRVSEHARTPKSTIHDWWRRFHRNGWEGLVDASRRPHRTHPVPPKTVARVLEVRRREGWCSEAIEAYLKAQGIQISHGSIHTILKQNQLITKSYKLRRRRTFTRFARDHPDSLWQTDIKYYRDHYLIAFLDDCSRYLPAANLYSEATTDSVLQTLEEALSTGRTPTQILSDHGTQLWSNDGPGRFTNYCTQHGIEHILGSTGKPTTQGKIERFWQTFELYYPRFNNIAQFREYYNQKPHRSPNYKTPEQVYFN